MNSEQLHIKQITWKGRDKVQKDLFPTCLGTKSNAVAYQLCNLTSLCHNFFNSKRENSIVYLVGYI